jgi:hypothetical protein
VESLRATARIFNPLIAALLGLLKIAAFLPLLYVLFGFAFGFATPVHFAAVAARWMIAHPAEDWLGVRIVAGLLFAYAALACLFILSEPNQQYVQAVPTPPPAPPTANVGNGFGRYAIQDFRERSAFGDASLAQKQEIARALQGHNVPHRPLFED